MDIKKRNIVVTLVVLLAIGFASVSSTLIIRGLLAIGENKDDFKIIFTSATLDGVEKNDVISESKTEISYESKVLSLVNEESTLVYEATNTSRNYDADVSIVCNIVDEDENIIEGENEYVDMTYTPESMELLAGETKSGSITAKLKKAVTEPMDIHIKCTLNGTAKERDELPTTTTKKVEEPYEEADLCFGTECFYIIKNNGTNVELLAKYNLEVGYNCPSTLANSCKPLINPSGIQNKDMTGYVGGSQPRTGVMPFSSTRYWDKGNATEEYVYNDKSNLYEPVENYVKYLNDNFNLNATGMIISREQLNKLGCSKKDVIGEVCSSAPSWVFSTSYWTGSPWGSNSLTYVQSNKISSNKMIHYFDWDGYNLNNCFGVRPVITIPSEKLSEAKKDEPPSKTPSPQYPVLDCGLNSSQTYKFNQWTLKDLDCSGDISNNDLITVGTESFYVFDIEGDTVKAISQYNLYVGKNNTGKLDKNYNFILTSIADETNLQDQTAIGTHCENDNTTNKGIYPSIGVVAYDENYKKDVDEYDVSTIKKYVDIYANKLAEMNANINGARLITPYELQKAGCASSDGYCKYGPEYLYSTSYWSVNSYYVSACHDGKKGGTVGKLRVDNNTGRGVRPVIEISKSLFE